MLYPGSDPAKVQSMTWGGKASAAGVFGASRATSRFTLSAEGEYCAKILATYTDAGGNLWSPACAMRVWSTIPTVPSWRAARSYYTADSYLVRGETHDEGYIDALPAPSTWCTSTFPTIRATCF